MVKLGLVKRECVATSIHITVQCSATTVTGNASIETQTVSNITLAKNRANTTLEKLFQEGISKGRLSAKESFSTNQSDKIKPKERNAIIKFNFPRK